MNIICSWSFSSVVFNSGWVVLYYSSYKPELKVKIVSVMSIVFSLFIILIKFTNTTLALALDQNTDLNIL